jgi:hypothetical protein
VVGSEWQCPWVGVHKEAGVAWNCFFLIAVGVNVGEVVVEIAVSVLEIRSKAVSELRVAGVHGSEFTGRTVAERRRRNPQ